MSSIDFQTLTSIPLLEGLRPEDVAALLPLIETMHYKKGDILFREGDPGGALMIVALGEVEIFIFDENQNRIVLSVVKERGFFGEVSLFDHGPRTANAIALGHTHVWVLRRDVMEAYIMKYPTAALHLIAVLAKRVRDANLLITSKYRDPFEVLQEQSNFWDRLADRTVRAVGSWPYLSGIAVVCVIWLLINGMHFVDWDAGFNVLNIVLVVLAALQLPLVMMSQRRQEAYEHVLMDIDHQVNLQAQLALLDVTRKLDTVHDTLTAQVERLEKLEQIRMSIHSHEAGLTDEEHDRESDSV
jgi:uncharacterized membrane protein